MKWLVRLLILYRPYWGWQALGTIVAVIALLANVALMGTSGWFITAMGIAGSTGGSLDYFTPAAMIRAFAILRTGGRYGERLLTHEATFRMIARLRTWLYRHLEPQSPLVLDAYHSGDLNNRLRTDVDRLETVYLRIFGPFAVALAASLALLVWLGRFSGPIAIVEGVCLGCSGVAVPLLLNRYSRPWSRQQVRLTVRLTESAVDAMQGMGELLAFGAAQRHSDRFAATSRELVALQVKMGRLAGLSQAAMVLGANLALWGTVVLAIPLIREGGLAPSDFVMMSLITLAGFEAVAPLPAACFALGGVFESAERIFALSDACPPKKPSGAQCHPAEPCNLRLSDVTFGYGENVPPVLNGLNLDLPHGRRLALVGPTGAGKSTLVLLLTGLLCPNHGQIFLNGLPSTDYDPEALRHCFAVAPQNPSLFTGTIRDNLLLGRMDATETQMWQALHVVELDEFATSLPGGLDCPLGEAGLTLSGGEARRLSIARALLRDAPVLILDEPGEGLDYQTEKTMLKAIVSALAGRSLLLITHRKAGLDLMDEVVQLVSQHRKNAATPADR